MTNIFRVSTLVIVLGLATLVQAQSLPTPCNFTDSLDGAQPDASVVPALLASDKERVLWKFNGADGGRPEGTLIFDAVGNLYGTTEYAGANGEGNAVSSLNQPSDRSATVGTVEAVQYGENAPRSDLEDRSIVVLASAQCGAINGTCP